MVKYLRSLRTIVLLLVVFNLSGCAVFQAYNSRGYDPVEYGLVNTITTTSEQHVKTETQCKDVMGKLMFQTTEFKNFATGLSNNDRVGKTSVDFYKLVLNDKNNMDSTGNTPFFCNLSIQQIHDSSKNIQKGIGGLQQ